MERYLSYTSMYGGETVESILRGKLRLSSGLTRRLKRVEHAILRNGKSCYSNERVEKGDRITVNILAGEERLRQIEPMDGALTVIYEDEDLLVLDKPAGLLVHSAPGKRESVTLANLLAGYLGSAYPFHAVNRLDKGTSGLMTVAKSGYVHERLSEILHTEAYERTYLAICVGQVEPSGRIDAPIGRSKDSVIRREVTEEGAASSTLFYTVAYTGTYSLVRLRPLTGRTHQLRVHMSYMGYPLVGDFLYGEESTVICRPALHSAYLSFVHPVTGEYLSFSSPLPSDMEILLQ